MAMGSLHITNVACLFSTVHDIWQTILGFRGINRKCYETIFNATLWYVWIEQNRVCFGNGTPKSSKSFAALVISRINSGFLEFLGCGKYML